MQKCDKKLIISFPSFFPGGIPMTTTMFLFVVVVIAAAATAHAQHLGDTFDDEDNELTSIDVQEGDTVKLECRWEKY